MVRDTVADLTASSVAEKRLSCRHYRILTIDPRLLITVPSTSAIFRSERETGTPLKTNNQCAAAALSMSFKLSERDEL
ncbi:hypothetical protein SLA2020_409870 [Shorea laevis]